MRLLFGLPVMNTVQIRVFRDEYTVGPCLIDRQTLAWSWINTGGHLGWAKEKV